jgi:hypothetical protein
MFQNVYSNGIAFLCPSNREPGSHSRFVHGISTPNIRDGGIGAMSDREVGELVNGKGSVVKVLSTIDETKSASCGYRCCIEHKE